MFNLSEDLFVYEEVEEYVTVEVHVPTEMIENYIKAKFPEKCNGKKVVFYDATWDDATDDVRFELMLLEE